MEKINNRAKILAVLLAAAILALAFIVLGQNRSNFQTSVLASFDDVPESHQYSKVINFLKDNEVVNGYNDGTFKPDNPLTRAEFTKIIVLGTDQNFTPATEAPFPDVPLGEWYTDYIAYCAHWNYIEGYPDGNFKPNQEITKTEALKILGELVGWNIDSIDTNNTQNPYSDVDLNTWYGPYVAYAISKNLLDDNGSSLGAGVPITRGQMSEYIYRDYAVRELGIAKYDTSYDSEILGYNSGGSGTPKGSIGNSVNAAEPTGSYFRAGGALVSDYEAAIQIVQELVGNHPNKDTLIAFMEPIPYASGSELAAYDFSSTNGKSDPETLQNDTWLAFIDNYPSAGWNHPTQFVLIDADTLEYEVRYEDSWPVVNNYSLWSHEQMRAQTEFWAYPTDGNLDRLAEGGNTVNGVLLAGSLVGQGIPDKSPSEWTWEELDEAMGGWEGLQRDLKIVEAKETPMEDFAPSCECTSSTGKKMALLIDGMDQGGFLEEVTHHIKDLPERWDLLPHYKGLKEQGYDVTYISSGVDEDVTYAPEGADIKDLRYTTLENIEQAFEDVADQLDCCDEIVVMFSGHGDGYSISMNPKRYIPRTTLQELDAPNEKGETWEVVNLEPVEVGSDKGGVLEAEDIQILLDSLRACRQKVIISACYSGGLLDKGVGEIPASGCSCRTVYVSSAADKVTWENSDGLVTVMGKSLESGSSLLEAFFKAYQSVTDRGNRSNFPIMSQSATDLCEDPDNDGICTGLEIEYNMNPDLNDTDGDGISDRDEWDYTQGPGDGTQKLTDPVLADTDRDGIGDGDELVIGTDPTDPDSDNDGIKDGDEVYTYGLNPLNTDTDNDGYEDYDDLFDNRTNPLNPDTDGDGCTDGEEVHLYGTDPSNPESKGLNCGCDDDPNCCDGIIVDLQNDDENCGECNNCCAELGENCSCVEGECECESGDSVTIQFDCILENIYHSDFGIWENAITYEAFEIDPDTYERRYANLNPDLETEWSGSTNGMCQQEGDTTPICQDPITNQAVLTTHLATYKTYSFDDYTTAEINADIGALFENSVYHQPCGF